MPTEHKKKKSTKSEKKVPIVIKTEPEELKPLDNYVDDRVALIQQIFSTLKSKTIQSIVPDFLQSKSDEEIQEICLEEVLGISKKRLLSIINATKCPSDTESSDSDVDKVEEHISLEEISSDSNDELTKPKKKKKHTKKENNKTTVPQENVENNGNTGEKQYSMLELLELQARARAIRSQLALEPVTKIELDDSDSESPDSSTNNITGGSDGAPTNNGEMHSEKTAEPTNSTQTEAPKVTRPIRLRRNFRQRQNQQYETTPEKEIETPKEKTPPKPIQPEKKEPEKVANDQQPMVPADDDIIPVIAEPEVLCISSSDSEGEERKKPKEKKKSYITMPVIEKEVREPTEDELFLQKIKLDVKKKIENNESIKKSTDEKSSSDKEVAGGGTSSKSPNANESGEAPEDGEIVEDDEIFEIQESSDESSSETTKKPQDDTTAAAVKNINESTQNTSTDVQNENSQPTTDHSMSEGSDSEADSASEKSAQTAKKSTIDDDDDDIIDLGKDDDDLDFDMNEPEEQNKSARQTRSKTKATEIGARDSSNEDQSKDDQSWDKRWLRGSKVTKVLATSKLASRVRSKIKEKKTKTANETKKIEDIEMEKSEKIDEIPPNVEVGSVEHYKELTKQK